MKSFFQITLHTLCLGIIIVCSSVICSGEEVEMVLVQGGILSTSNELDGTEVSTFHIGRYPVKWREWKKVRDWAVENGYDLGGIGGGCADEHPAQRVNWFDVVKWCNAISEKNGLTPVYTVVGVVYRSGQPNITTISQDLSAGGYRLALESEWEFAARGGNLSKGFTYAGSDDWDEVGWYYGNSIGSACFSGQGKGTWPVGQKAANELGLYDMSGNVKEWCWDPDEAFPLDRQIRGGSWFNLASSSTVAARTHLPANGYPFRSTSIGFRLARSWTK